MSQGKVLYDYSAAEADEITIQRGERFSLLQSYDDDWWLIQVNGKQGMAPSNFLSLDPPPSNQLVRQNSTELLRIQTLREEAAVKIDELR